MVKKFILFKFNILRHRSKRNPSLSDTKFCRKNWRGCGSTHRFRDLSLHCFNIAARCDRRRDYSYCLKCSTSNTTSLPNITSLFAGVCFFCHEISEFPRPIAAKLSHIIKSAFIIPVHNFGRGPSPRN